jgi:hypothetical protein
MMSRLYTIPQCTQLFTMDIVKLISREIDDNSEFPFWSLDLFLQVMNYRSAAAIERVRQHKREKNPPPEPFFWRKWPVPAADVMHVWTRPITGQPTSRTAPRPILGDW